MAKSRVNRTNAGVAVGIVAAVAILGGGILWDRERGAVDPGTIAAASSGSVSFTEGGDPQPVEAAPLQAVVDKLRNQSQPVTIAVVGDSTGNDENEWVHASLGRLSTTYGRAVTARVWDGEVNDYRRTWTWPGSGEMTVWNGSAPGRGITYALEHVDTMLPEGKPDLVILNHGHNVRGAIAGEANQFVDAMTKKWGSLPAFVVTLQNPRTDADMAGQDQRMRNLKGWAEARGVDVIDAYALFKNHPDLPSLLNQDQLHPSPAGSQLWTNAVGQTLGF